MSPNYGTPRTLESYVVPSTPKYKGFNDPIDNVPMAWNVHPSGLPIRHGDSPGLITAAHLQHATYTLFARSAVFKIPADLEQYNKIIDWLANTPSQKTFEHVKDDPNDGGAWIVWLGWIEARGVIPAVPKVG